MIMVQLCDAAPSMIPITTTSKRAAK